LGAGAKLDTVPGAAEFAFPFSTLEDACVRVWLFDFMYWTIGRTFVFTALLVSLQKVDNKLKELERRKFGKDSLIRVAVVGCGYSGVELAATVSERLQDRGLVQAINVNTTILPTAPPGNREAALKVRYLDFGSGTKKKKKILLVQYLVTLLHTQRDMN